MPPRRRKPERVLRWDVIPEPRRPRVPQGGPYQRGQQEVPPLPASGGPWPIMECPPGENALSLGFSLWGVDDYARED
eukprot:4583393-Alexandrium_andersonii.AAC.1